MCTIFLPKESKLIVGILSYIENICLIYIYTHIGMYISIFLYLLVSIHICVWIHVTCKYHHNPKTFARGRDQWSRFLTVWRSWGASLYNFCLQFTRNTKDKFLLYVQLLQAVPYRQIYSTNNINNSRVGIKSLKLLTQLLSKKKPRSNPPKKKKHTKPLQPISFLIMS